MSQQQYSKPPSSIPDQIAILDGRGLVIKDIHLIEHFLTHVGYYRLAGYWQIFQNDRIQHTFIPGTSFEQIIELYDFDRELRIMLYDAIERIEISFRTNLTHQLCISYGALWFNDEKYMDDKTRHKENIAAIIEEVERSKEGFIKHHDDKYGKKDFPPAWKTFQVLSFGSLSKIYSNLSSTLPEKNVIARILGLPNYVYLESWIQTICIIRNLCAHHSRIANRKFDFPPKKLVKSTYPWIIQIPANQHQSMLLYNQLCTVKFILNRCSPNNHFTQKLLTLLSKYPSLNIKGMGFPTDWNKEDLWHI